MPRFAPGVSGNPAGRSHHAKGEKDERYSSKKTDEACPLCGVIICDHQRCITCTALIGPGHYDTHTINDRCLSCEGARQRAARGAPV